MKKLYFQFFCFCIISIISSSHIQSQTDFDSIDKFAQNIPDTIGKDLHEITLYISRKSKTDTEKVRGIFTWIITNISYDHASAEGPFPVGKEIKDILTSRKAICIGYAKLFQKMCQIAGFECEVVSGYSRENPTSKNIIDAPDHAWNAIQLNGQWQLVDATWSASLRKSKPGKKLNPEVEEYFLAPASKFLESHLPALPWWQLVESPINMKTFRSGSDAISAHLSTISNYSYKDSIQIFRDLSPQIKKIREAEVGWNFLPTEKNLKQYIAILMEYASEMTDSLINLQSTGPIDSLISRQYKLIELCRFASSLDTLLPWHKELYAEALINHIVAQHRKVNGRPDKKLKIQLLEFISETLIILNSAPESYYTKSAMSICQEFKLVISQ